nr:hypothetical protein [Dictyobacter vulcani]
MFSASPHTEIGAGQRSAPPAKWLPQSQPAEHISVGTFRYAAAIVQLGARHVEPVI